MRGSIDIAWYYLWGATYSLSMCSGEQDQTPVADVNLIHVEDVQDTQGNAHTNDDINDTIFVSNEFSDT